MRSKFVFTIPAFFITLLILTKFSYGQQLNILTINVWSGLDYDGFFKMGEYEKPVVRDINLCSFKPEHWTAIYSSFRKRIRSESIQDGWLMISALMKFIMSAKAV